MKTYYLEATIPLKMQVSVEAKTREEADTLIKQRVKSSIDFLNENLRGVNIFLNNISAEIQYDKTTNIQNCQDVI